MAAGEDPAMEEKMACGMAGLRRAVAEHRARRAEAGIRLRWSGEVRRRAIALMAEGRSIGELSRTAGIPREALRAWRRRAAAEGRDRAGFSELRVVPVATSGASAAPSSPSVKVFTLLGSHGNSVTGLHLHHIAALLQAGLL
jgi:hypothetical protein